MPPSDQRDRYAVLETWRGSWMFLAFGLTILAYLVAIEHPHWFVLRPASGTAVAMASAAQDTSAKNAGAVSAKP